jgi:hypothetical protein
MILNSHKKDALEYIVIDDLYSEEELRLIKTELVELIPHLWPIEITRSATNEDNTYKKDCMAILADKFYEENRDTSNILKASRKLFCDEIASYAEKINAFYGHIKTCNEDYTLINFYKSGEQYKSHKDASIFTAITFIELGSINGGGLIFTDFNEHIPFKNNRMILFPGCVEHKTEVIITSVGSYRVSIAQFLNYRKS